MYLGKNKPFAVTFIIILFTATGCIRKIDDNRASARPNIILIMSDDMGFSDIGCYGGEIRTPNLDKLAANGIRFTQFYNTARCCPTRASLLTGLYPHQAGMGWMTVIQTDLLPYKGDLSSNSVTLAEVAKSAGYQAFITGKWHVCKNISNDGPKDNWPLQRGFDRFYGTVTGAGNYYDPATLCRDNGLITPFTDSMYSGDNYYYTDAISHEAVRFIQERKKDTPFFLYIAYTAAHWPMHAKPKNINKYKGMYDAGWEEIRKQRYQRMISMGLLNSGTELSPLDVHPWDEEPHKDVQAARMEVYAAMIDAMDQGIGHVMETLMSEGIMDNTVILFLQDNGGCAEEIGTKGRTRPWAESKNELVPLKANEIEYKVIPRVTREGRTIMQGEGITGGTDTTYVAYGKVWANVSNTPFREYKHWVYEGGISTPLIVYYPYGIKDKNRLCDVPGHVIDLMPTIVELSGAEYPEMYSGNSIQPMEGISLVPLFYGDSLERNEPICWEHEMNRAVRSGDWKLVSKGELFNGSYGQWKNYRTGEWELYNIRNDRSEMHDLSSEYPEKLNEMVTMWDNYARRIHIFPAPWEPLPE